MKERGTPAAWEANRTCARCRLQVTVEFGDLRVVRRPAVGERVEATCTACGALIDIGAADQLDSAVVRAVKARTI